KHHGLTKCSIYPLKTTPMNGTIRDTSGSAECSTISIVRPHDFSFWTIRCMGQWPSSALNGLDQLLQAALPVLNIFLHVIDNFQDLFISAVDLLSNVVLKVVELINSFFRE